MNQKKTKALIGLLALFSLASCTVRGKRETPAAGDSTGTSCPADGTSGNKEEEWTVIEAGADPYAAVLEGLDKSKAEHTGYSSDAHTEDQGDGYYDTTDGWAYGWAMYTVASWGNAAYGVAVKMKFDENHLFKDIKVGAPAEGYTDFSSSYADGSIMKIGNKIYTQEYCKRLEKDIMGALFGMPAYDIMAAFAGLHMDDTGSEGMEKWIVREDETYDLLGTGATQTDTRLQKAMYHASLAYCVDNYNALDPFYNEGNYLITDDTKVKEATAMMEVASDEAETTLKAHGIKTSDTTYVGFGAYQVPAWYSYYGAGIELTVDSAKKITSVKLGYPFAVVGAWHNFTPSYIQTNPQAFADYVANCKNSVEELLLNQTVNNDLVNKVDNTTMVIPKNGKEGGSQSAEEKFVTTAGGTQTNSRLNLAILGALNAILA